MTIDNSYNRKEKLKSRKMIERLFSSGKSFTVFPLKFIYIHPEEALDFPIKTGVGASGRHFKKAVHRNRVKRLLREAYRVNKAPLHQWSESNTQQVAIFILYIDKTIPTLEVLQQKMNQGIEKLIKECSIVNRQS